MAPFLDQWQIGRKRFGEIAYHGNIRNDVLADLCLVKFKVDDFGIGGKAVQPSGDAVIETHAHRNQDIAALDRPVCKCLAVHAPHPQTQRMGFGDVACAQECRDNRNTGLLDQLQ